MRSLSSTLLAAQKGASRVPYASVSAGNTICGVVRLKWTRLYSGEEADYFHALTLPSDGSLIRVRVTPPDDARKLYRQRVTNPGPESDFSQWTYCDQYNIIVAACCSLGAEVSIFWVNTNRQIYRLKSVDHGATWGSPELVDYSPTTAVKGMAAAYKPSGDLALFYADQSTLFVQKHINGNWQSSVAWDKTAGDLSGVAVVYDGDWNLLVTGKDSDDNFKLWSLVYGDGGEVSSGTWSDLKELASAPSDGDFEYRQVFLDKPDVYRCFFVEKFTGTQSYDRPFWSHSVPDAKFIDSLWREPVPFDLSSEYGVAIAHHGDYCWLSMPPGVWRAGLTEKSLDLTADVLSLRQALSENQGSLVVEVRNDDGRYASPGGGELESLDIGCQLALSPGYVTSEGNEVSTGLTFSIDAQEHISLPGKASLVLHASDGWRLLQNWNARHQFRWNKETETASVKDILAFVLARVGLKLEVNSQSSLLTGFYPDFTIHPGNRGDVVLSELLSFVSDIVFIEDGTAYVVNPLSSDASVYSYGSGHPMFQGRYQSGAWGVNRVRVEGYDAVSDSPVMVDSFDWSEIARCYDRLHQVEDKNIDTVNKAQERGEAHLRRAEIGSAKGVIHIPVNCGQQMFDVIDITDKRAGLDDAKMRVLGIALTYEPHRGKYEQQLSLEAV
ncbi:hypothetical protein ACFLWY_02455 [Chloroflexota bacterium]